jgi:hypothetical protein
MTLLIVGQMTLGILGNTAYDLLKSLLGVK